jgi:hypothetical protein
LARDGAATGCDSTTAAFVGTDTYISMAPTTTEAIKAATAADA